ncbi:MAG: 3-phosphoshikimate 1-carboxyvinyltransferase, partial [Alloprevotella sp.]|nr:3-phosphoshikimate 1-carboxyvinyltransferase [Alloprevotella sp.]
MQKQIYLQPTLRGTACLPASKSISNRVLLLNRMAGGTCRIMNLSEADDTRVLADALERAEAGSHSDGSPLTIDIGAAGTAMRFLTAYLATRPGHFRLTGSARMRQRPIGILVDALRSLGADIRYCGEEGFPPLEIHGRRLHGGRLALPADVSSQYVSALLMTAPALCGADLELSLEGAVASRPYIDMTLALMREFGGEAEWAAPDRLLVRRRPYGRTAPFEVEADWSAASYWYELVALSPDAEAELLLPGLRAESVQGDA